MSSIAVLGEGSCGYSNEWQKSENWPSRPKGPDQDWAAARTLIEKCFAPTDRERGVRKLAKLLQKNPWIALGRGCMGRGLQEQCGVSLAWLAAFFDLHEAVEMLAPLSKLDEAAEGDTR